MLKYKFWIFLLICLWNFMLPLLGQESDYADKGESISEEQDISMFESEVEPSVTVQITESKVKDRSAGSNPQTERKIVNIQPGFYKVRVQSSLIVREKASRSGVQVSTLSDGSEVDVKSCSNGWAYIHCGIVTGYVSTAYLVPHDKLMELDSEQEKGIDWNPWEKLAPFIIMLVFAIFVFIGKNNESTMAYVFGILLGILQLVYLLFVPMAIENILPAAIGMLSSLTAIACWLIASIACFLAYYMWWDSEEYEDFPPFGYLLISVLSAIVITFSNLSLILGLIAAVIASVVYHLIKSVTGFGIFLHLTACLACALTLTTLIAYFI